MLHILESQQEMNAFDYFRHRTASQLAGFYQCESWCRLILQLVHADPAVRHAACALACVHRAFESGAGACIDLDDFGRCQYVLATRKHVESLKSLRNDARSLVSYVGSCLLFACIELIQFRVQSAAALVRHGVKLLHALSGWTQTPHDSIEIYERFLRRLRAQCIPLVGSEGFEDIDMAGPANDLVAAKSVPINSVEIARQHFQLYRSWYDNTHWRGPGSKTQTSHCGPLVDITRQYRKITAAYGQDLRSLQGIVENESNCDEIRAFSLLKLRHLFQATLQNIAAACADTYERQDAWDAQTKVFEEILDLCEKAMGLCRQEYLHYDRPRRYSFTLDFGTVAPLSDVAHLCRDPQIRRRAIELLRLQPRREGLADSLLMARISERIVQLEELGSSGMVMFASDIPPDKRIRRVVPSFDATIRTAIISFYKQGDSIPHREHVALDTDLAIN